MYITINSVWLGLLIIVTLVNIVTGFVTRFNDVKHLKEDFQAHKTTTHETMWKKIDELRDDTIKQGERLATLEGRDNIILKMLKMNGNT